MANSVAVLFIFSTSTSQGTCQGSRTSPVCQRLVPALGSGHAVDPGEHPGAYYLGRLVEEGPGEADLVGGAEDGGEDVVGLSRELGDVVLGAAAGA